MQKIWEPVPGEARVEKIPGSAKMTKFGLFGLYKTAKISERREEMEKRLNKIYECAIIFEAEKGKFTGKN